MSIQSTKYSKINRRYLRLGWQTLNVSGCNSKNVLLVLATIQVDRLGSSFQFHDKMNHLFQSSIILAQILVLQFINYAIHCNIQIL